MYYLSLLKKLNVDIGYLIQLLINRREDVYKRQLLAHTLSATAHTQCPHRLPPALEPDPRSGMDLRFHLRTLHPDTPCLAHVRHLCCGTAPGALHRDVYKRQDLYKAQMDSLGGWQVTHLGAPMNSPANDYAIPFAPKPQSGLAEEGLSLIHISLRLFGLSWSDLKRGKTRSNSPTSKLKCADICDGVLLIVLSLVALVALSSLSLYEVGVPQGDKLKMCIRDSLLC